MAKEIERKFLVVGDEWRSQATGVHYRQGYISTTAPGHSVRVRIAGGQGYLTIKGPSRGLSRSEFEYEIPMVDAEEMLETLCDRPQIDKHRYCLPIGAVVWEVDEFHGANKGLIIAEVELTSEDQAVDLPSWVGEEVSGDPKYYNSSLTKFPFCDWDA